MNRFALILAVLAANIASLAQQPPSQPEHLYPTKEEYLALQSIQYDINQYVEKANTDLKIRREELQKAGDKIIRDHGLEGKFVFDTISAQFTAVPPKGKEKQQPKDK